MGGIPELVKNEISGLLVPPNDPKALVDAVNKLLEDKERTEKFIHAGYDYVMKNMTWKVILPKYIEFYEKLLSTNT